MFNNYHNCLIIIGIVVLRVAFPEMRHNSAAIFPSVAHAGYAPLYDLARRESSRVREFWVGASSVFE